MTVWMMPPVSILLVASLVHVHLVSEEMVEQVLVGVDVQVLTMICCPELNLLSSHYITDIDECNEGSDSCGDGFVCVNTPGSFRCDGR